MWGGLSCPANVYAFDFFSVKFYFLIQFGVSVLLIMRRRERTVLVVIALILVLRNIFR